MGRRRHRSSPLRAASSAEEPSRRSATRLARTGDASPRGIGSAPSPQSPAQRGRAPARSTPAHPSSPPRTAHPSSAARPLAPLESRRRSCAREEEGTAMGKTSPRRSSSAASSIHPARELRLGRAVLTKPAALTARAGLHPAPHRRRSCYRRRRGS
ncbi:unnamed protein product [Urochloa humidicola]